MLYRTTNFLNFLEESLINLECERITKTYIISILKKFQTENKIITDSLTLKYKEASEKQNFYMFQEIGDWIFFVETLFPEYLNACPKNYYYTLGQVSYDKCYKMLRKEWRVYEELADNLPKLIIDTRQILKSEKIAQ